MTDKGNGQTEVPMQKVDETPPLETEADPLPTATETPATDPVMEELLRQKEQLLKEIVQ